MDSGRGTTGWGSGYADKIEVVWDPSSFSFWPERKKSPALLSRISTRDCAHEAKMQHSAAILESRIVTFLIESLRTPKRRDASVQ